MEQTGLVYIARDKENIPYVGSTIRGLEMRRKEHEQRAKYADTIFHKALLEKGLDAFTWEILEDNIPIDKLTERERYWAKVYDACKNGYNGKRVFRFPLSAASNMKGKHHSEETKQKQREAKLGKHQSEETRRKRSESNKGKPSSFKGKHHSEEAKQKQRESHLGKHQSEETRRKRSESLKGKNKGKPSGIKGKHRVYNPDGTYVYR